MINKLAQTSTNLGDPLTGEGPPGLENQPLTEAPNILNSVLSIVIGLLTTIAAIWFVFLVITGAYSWMSAGGDKAAVQTAQKKITSGMIGLAIIISAMFILDWAGELLGLRFVTDPGAWVESINP